MTLVADFNMINEQGQLPALVSAADLARLPAGTKVIVVDGEGLECQAEVVRGVETPRGAYVLLAPIGGTWQRDSEGSNSLTTF